MSHLSTIRFRVRDFTCPNCGQHLAFENSLCLSCNSQVGFSPELIAFLVIDPEASGGHDGAVAASEYQLCANLHLAQCNWLVKVQPVRALCASCSLTRTRPANHDVAALAAFAEAEQAKRRLLVDLYELQLPVLSREQDPEYGLAFDLLSNVTGSVSTGHSGGVITLDLAEGDDLYRERVRVQMDEPYRTVLGHFRHEIGHYYFPRLVLQSDAAERFRMLFGDPGISYREARDRHYAQGPPGGWEVGFISAYASMHPAEDWAETFAHYLHIRSVLDTAAAFGHAPANATYQRKVLGPSGFDTLITMWLPLAWSLNMVNRSIGQADLYPFVLPAPVLEKMRFVHAMVEASQE